MAIDHPAGPSSAPEERFSTGRNQQNTCTFFCTFAVMETVPLSDVRSNLSAFVERVEATHERVTITRNGRRAAVLISPEDLDAFEESLDVLSDPNTMSRLREGEAALEAGDVVDEVGLRALMLERLR